MFTKHLLLRCALYYANIPGRALIKLNFREKQAVHTHNQDLRIPVHYLIF